MSHPVMPRNPWRPLLREPSPVPRSVSVARHLAESALRKPAKANGAGGDITRYWEAGKAIDLLLVCSPGLFADGLIRILSDLAQGVEVHTCTPDRALERPSAPDLVVIDIDALGERSAQVVRELASQVGAPMVLIASSVEDARTKAMLARRAATVLSKSTSRREALDVIRRVLDETCAGLQPTEAHALHDTGARANDGLPPQRAGAANSYGLTPSEMKVLTLLCEGLPNLAIARRLGIQEGTVKIHLNKAYEKLGVQNRTQAVRVAERLDPIRDMQLERAESGVFVVDWLLPHMTDEFRRRGEVLFREGDPGDTLYYIHQGRVALQEIDKVLGDGELLGEIAIFTPEGKRTCTACCETDTRLFRLSANQARRLYLENPRFAYHVLQLITQRLMADRSRTE